MSCDVEGGLGGGQSFVVPGELACRRASSVCSAVSSPTSISGRLPARMPTSRGVRHSLISDKYRCHPPATPLHGTSIRTLANHDQLATTTLHVTTRPPEEKPKPHRTGHTVSGPGDINLVDRFEMETEPVVVHVEPLVLRIVERGMTLQDRHHPRLIVVHQRRREFT